MLKAKSHMLVVIGMAETVHMLEVTGMAETVHRLVQRLALLHLLSSL